MNPDRFSSVSLDRLPAEQPASPKAFVAVPCLFAACGALYQSQLYAWAVARAQAEQAALKPRLPELFGIFN